MKVNSIQSIIPFRGVTSTDKDVPKQVFGTKLKEFEALSDAKDINLWALKSTGGCMVNPQSGYLILLQGQKDGVIHKELKCGIQKDSVDELNKKLEKCLIWANAETNIRAAQEIGNSAFAKEDPRAAQAVQKVLYQTGVSPEAAFWKRKLDEIV